MSYDAIVQGLEERLRTVANVYQVLDFNPTSIEPPTIVSVFRNFQREGSGQITAMRYFTVHTLALRWTDNEQAERELRPFINSVCAAIDVDPQLGGRCAWAKIISGEGDWATIGGVEYRVCDFVSEVLEKATFRSGI